jgi:hypothetical protein
MNDALRGSSIHRSPGLSNIGARLSPADESGCSENPPGVWRGLPTVAHRLRPPASACFERGSLAMFEVAGSLWYRVCLAPRSWDSAIGYRYPLGSAASSRTIGHRRFPARLKAASTSWPVESSGSVVDAMRRAEYQWPERLGPRLVEKTGVPAAINFRKTLDAVELTTKTEPTPMIFWFWTRPAINATPWCSRWRLRWAARSPNRIPLPFRGEELSGKLWSGTFA